MAKGEIAIDERYCQAEPGAGLSISSNLVAIKTFGVVASVIEGGGQFTGTARLGDKPMGWVSSQSAGKFVKGVGGLWKCKVF